jgi:hypothetical protein
MQALLPGRGRYVAISVDPTGGGDLQVRVDVDATRQAAGSTASYDGSYAFLLPMSDYRLLPHAIVLETGTGMGRYGHISVRWSSQELPPGMLPAASQRCAQSSAPISADLQSTARGAIQLSLPGDGPVSASLVADNASLERVLPPAGAPGSGLISVSSNGGGAGVDTRTATARIRQTLGDKVTSLNFSLSKQTTSSIVTATLFGDTMLFEGQTRPALITSFSTVAVSTAPPLAAESHTVSNVLTTANSTLHIGTDLRGQVHYHGPFGSLSLAFAAKQVTTQKRPRGSMAFFSGSCGGKIVRRITTPATTTATGRVTASGTVTFTYGPAPERYVFTDRDQGSISIGRRS